MKFLMALFVLALAFQCLVDLSDAKNLRKREALPVAGHGGYNGGGGGGYHGGGHGHYHNHRPHYHHGGGHYDHHNHGHGYHHGWCQRMLPNIQLMF